MPYQEILSPRFLRTDLANSVRTSKPLSISRYGHSPPQRLGTSDRVSGKQAWRGAPCEIERVARASAIKYYLVVVAAYEPYSSPITLTFIQEVQILTVKLNKED